MNIVIIQGHPDTSQRRYCHALAEAYAAGAAEGGHEVRVIDVARSDFPLLRSREEWYGETPAAIAEAQQHITWANHIVVIYPLWLGGQPALLKGFLEQLFRPGFGSSHEGSSMTWKKLLTGRTSRTIVTMGMPAFIYRWYFGAWTLKALEWNIFDFVGIGPNRDTVIGNVEGITAEQRADWLREVARLGKAGQ